MDERDEIARRLDEVVGTRYHEARNVSERIRLGWRKWALAGVFAVAAMCAVVLLIEKHRLPPMVPKQSPKPVTVEIVPAR